MYPDLAELLMNPFIIPVVAIIVAIGVPVVSATWADMEKHRRDTELKRTMIERGMSVEDIERVLAARTSDTKVKSDKCARYGVRRGWLRS